MRTATSVSWRVRAITILAVAAIVLTAGCARSPEAKKARYLERGDRYFKQQQYREAILEYRNALRIDSNNAQAVRQLGFAHYELGQIGQSFRFLLKAAELEPDNTQVPLKLATVYLLAGKPAEARGQADRVLQRDPKNLEALILAAGAATTPTEVDSAIQRIEGVRPEFDSQMRFHLALADLYQRKRDRPAAERELRAAIALEPNSADAHVNLGNFFALNGAVADAEREFKAAAALTPAASRIQLRLADLYLSIGKRDESSRLLTEITTKAPDYLPAWRRMAEIAFAEGRLDDTKKAVDMLLGKNASDLEAHLLLGRIRLARQEPTPAIQEFRTVLKAEPRFAPAHYYLGIAFLQAGDRQQAKAELREAINILRNFTDAILALARVNLESGAIQPAIDDLERLLVDQPKLTAAYALLGAAYLSQQKPALAGEVARKLIAVAPKDARGPDILGLSLAAQGKRRDAYGEFENSLALAPDYLEPLNHIVALALADKQLDAAITRVTKQLATVPQSGAHQALLGDLYLEKRDTKSAEAAFARALELNPRLVTPYLRLGSLYAQAGQYDRAFAKLNEVIKANPSNPAPLMLTGILYETEGNIPKAREAYEKTLAINPRFVPAANNLAWIYSEHGGDKEKALQLAQTAKELAPEDPRISDTLGWILYKRGVYRRALNLLTEAAAKLPNNPQVQYHLGMAYQQTGDKENARKALLFAASSSEAFTGKEEARQALAQLK